MADKLEIAKAKELRGDIVKTLYGLYGEAVPMGTLRTMLRYKSYNSEADIKKALEYLSGSDDTKKRFVSIRPSDGEYWAGLVKLTPEGVNLAEGDRPDEVGVIIDE